MTSISGSTVHFHSSFFEDKVRKIKQKKTWIQIIYGYKTVTDSINK